jgi:hypothetical protein
MFTGACSTDGLLVLFVLVGGTDSFFYYLGFCSFDFLPALCLRVELAVIDSCKGGDRRELYMSSNEERILN